MHWAQALERGIAVMMVEGVKVKVGEIDGMRKKIEESPEVRLGKEHHLQRLTLTNLQQSLGRRNRPNNLIGNL